MEGTLNNKKIILTDFALGLIIGVLISVVVFGVIAGIVHLTNKNKELMNYVDTQIEIIELQEDIINRPVDEFLQDPDIRRAADGASDEFIRKRDEILHRFRNRLAD